MEPLVDVTEFTDINDFKTKVNNALSYLKIQPKVIEDGDKPLSFCQIKDVTNISLKEAVKLNFFNKLTEYDDATLIKVIIKMMNEKVRFQDKYDIYLDGINNF